MKRFQTFSHLLEQFWVVHEEFIWSSERGWQRVPITAADCAFLAACNIRWS